MSKYKKSAVDFAGLDLPSKYQFRRTEWVKEPAAAGEFDISIPYPYDITLYTCTATIFWLDEVSTPPHEWHTVGTGILKLIKTINLVKTLPESTGTIVVTDRETGRELCREPIRNGDDFSFLQNKRAPTRRELRCMSFEVATGMLMVIACGSLEITKDLWKNIRELQKDVYLI